MLGSEGPGKRHVASLAHKQRGRGQGNGREVDIELKPSFGDSSSRILLRKERVSWSVVGVSESKFHMTLSK